MSMEERLSNLLSARNYMQRFLAMCKEYGLLDKEQLKKIDHENVRGDEKKTSHHDTV